VDIYANVEVFTGGRHRSCRLCMTCGDDDESPCTHAQTTTNGHTH